MHKTNKDTTEASYPLVSVVVRVYNLEDFIEKALNGILMQKYRGTIEVIVSNDHSSDATHDIVQRIIKEHPHGKWIRYTNQAENKGMIGNLIWALRQARGEYIAPCDGDDYWTDPLKLQKQVDFMRSNPDCTISGHAFKESYDDNRPDRIKQMVRKVSLCTLRDFLEGNGFRVWTNTMIFKTALVAEFEEWFKQAVNIDDFAIFMISGHHGRIGYLPEIMSVYNRESTPHAWSSRNSDINEILKYIQDKNEFFDYFNRLTHNQYKESIKKNQRRSLKRYAHNLNRQGFSRRAQFKLLRTYLGEYLKPQKENLIIWLNFIRG